MAVECPKCGISMEKGYLKDRAWLSGDGPRTLFLRGQGVMVTAWRCLQCGKVELTADS